MIYLELIVGGNRVDGDGATPEYRGQIEIDSFDWKISAKSETGDGKKYSGPVMTPKRVSLNKSVDPATPNLCKHMQADTQFSRATITMLTMASDGQGSSHQKLVQLILENGYIEDVSISVSESKWVSLTEKVTLSYAKSRLIYHLFDERRGGRGNKTSDFMLATPSAKS